MDIDRDRRFELKLDAGRPLPEVIADKVQSLVDEGFYRPGGRLDNESDLARRMKVARSSVRTALQRLEAQRVLEVRRGLGWYVRRSGSGDAAAASPLIQGDFRMSDLFELRIGLEGLAVSLAALRAEDGELADIAKYHQQFIEAGDNRDELLRTDIAFHEAIVKASKNELLLRSYQGIVGELTDWRYESYAVRGVPLRSAREHAKVLRYLSIHDPSGARVAMNGHLQRIYDELPDIAAEPLDLIQSRGEAEPQWHVGHAQV